MNSQLAAARYVNLVTFKRSGDAVETPVWCAPDGDELFVFSAGDAGKVKRLRNSDRARLAPCDFKGGLLGEWYEAWGVQIFEAAEVTRALRALRAKYGWQMRITNFFSRLSGRINQRAVVRLETT